MTIVIPGRRQDDPRDDYSHTWEQPWFVPSSCFCCYVSSCCPCWYHSASSCCPLCCPSASSCRPFSSSPASASPSSSPPSSRDASIFPYMFYARTIISSPTPAHSPPPHGLALPLGSLPQLPHLPIHLPAFSIVPCSFVFGFSPSSRLRSRQLVSSRCPQWRRVPP